MNLEEAVQKNSYQCLFYALCREMKELTYTKNGKYMFRKSVSVKAILDLDNRYQMAETAMIENTTKRLTERAG